MFPIRVMFPQGSELDTVSNPASGNEHGVRTSIFGPTLGPGTKTTGGKIHFFKFRVKTSTGVIFSHLQSTFATCLDLQHGDSSVMLRGYTLTGFNKR